MFVTATFRSPSGMRRSFVTRVGSTDGAARPRPRKRLRRSRDLGRAAPAGGAFELVVLDRPGFPPNPPVERVDFAVDAELVAGLLEHGDHLVGHSYGGVIALLAAASRPDLVRSLTVIEPPATSVAPDDPAVVAFAAGGAELYAAGTTDDPEAFLRRFLAAVGSNFVVALPTPAGPRAVRAGAHGRAWPVGSGHPAGRARGGRLPEAGRLGRAPSGLRPNLRRAGTQARRRASRAPRLRPRGAAPPRVQHRRSRTSSNGPRAARPSGARRSRPPCRSRVPGGGRAGS